MSNIRFEIIEEFGQLGTGKYSPELNKVKWNGGETKWDIRKWSEDGKTPYKGIVLDDAEAKQLLVLLDMAIKSSKNTTPLYEISMGKVNASILNVFGELSDSGSMSKQLTYVNWGYAPKYDIRGWTIDYKKCGKGITLNETEGLKLLEVLRENIKVIDDKIKVRPKGIDVNLDDDLLI